MFQFNSRALLIPEGIITTTIEEFEKEFVIKPGDEKRKQLFHQYQSYCDRLKAICGNVALTQWINGSYTTKNKKPADIDVITFIHSEIVKQNAVALKSLVYPQSMAAYQVDAYIIAVYPENSKLHFASDADRLYWLDHFSKTKPNRHRKRVEKGFLEIII